MILRPINDPIKNTPYHRDTEITERIFPFARLGDPSEIGFAFHGAGGDRTKKLSPSGGLCKGVTTSVGFYANRLLNDSTFSAFSCEIGCLVEFYPFVEIESIIACLSRCYLFIKNVPLRIGLFYNNPLVQDGGPFAHIEKGVGLL